MRQFGNLNDDSSINEFRKDLIKKFKYLSKVTVYHFMTDLGLNVLKPDRVLNRIFSRLGLISTTTKDYKTLKDHELWEHTIIGRNFASATGKSIRCVEALFVNYGQVGGDSSTNDFGIESGICLEESPKCNLCKLKNICLYKGSKK